MAYSNQLIAPQQVADTELVDGVYIVERRAKRERRQSKARYRGYDRRKNSDRRANSDGIDIYV